MLHSMHRAVHYAHSVRVPGTVVGTLTEGCTCLCPAPPSNVQREWGKVESCRSGENMEAEKINLYDYTGWKKWSWDAALLGHEDTFTERKWGSEGEGEREYTRECVSMSVAKCTILKTHTHSFSCFSRKGSTCYNCWHHAAPCLTPTYAESSALIIEATYVSL